MPEITDQRHDKTFSRRTFLAFTAAGGAAFGLFLIKEIDLPKAIQYFFGLPAAQRNVISNELRNLHGGDLLLYRRTKVYFSLYRMNLNRLARRFHKPVLGYWSSRLFADRSVTSIYMHYPAVDELSVCSGLIRRDA